MHLREVIGPHSCTTVLMSFKDIQKQPHLSVSHSRKIPPDLTRNLGMQREPMREIAIPESWRTDVVCR